MPEQAQLRVPVLMRVPQPLFRQLRPVPLPFQPQELFSRGSGALPWAWALWLRPLVRQSPRSTQVLLRPFSNGRGSVSALARVLRRQTLQQLPSRQVLTTQGRQVDLVGELAVDLERRHLANRITYCIIADAQAQLVNQSIQTLGKA